MCLNDILSALVREFGREVLQQQAQLLGLVTDRYPAAKREQRLLKVAYEATVVEDLLRDGRGYSQRRAVKRLAEDFVIEPEAARATVAALCRVLGFTVVELHSNCDSPEPDLSKRRKRYSQPKTGISARQNSGSSKAMLISGRYQDNDDGTVTDIQTGLQWMRCTLGQTWCERACSGKYKAFTFEEAAQAAAELNCSAGYAGYRDWRMPTREELESLVKQSSMPTIDGAAFPNTPATFYWSSSPYILCDAWGVGFGSGNSKPDSWRHHYAVRLVRSTR